MIAQAIRRFNSTAESGSVRGRPGVRAAGMAGSRLKYVDHPSFDDSTARTAMLTPLADLPDEGASPLLRLAPLPSGQVKVPILSREQEARLFRKIARREALEALEI